MKTSNAAKLPALPSVSTGNPALDKWVQAVTERLEVREGSRGNPNERAVTVRELTDMGFAGFGGRGFGSSGQAGNVLTVNADGSYSAMTPDAFAESIRKSKLYKDLMKRLDDASRFDDIPEQVRLILLQDIAAEAAKRGADIRRLENKLQSETQSLAYTVEEVTASVKGSMAGVRETVFASATEANATAGKVTQLVAALDGTGSATIEESMVVIADRTDGLRAQAMLKLNAGKAIAAVGLMASEDPTGATESKFIVQADQFALTGTFTYVQGDESSDPPVTSPSSATAGETWYNTRTDLSYRAAGGIWVEYAAPIPFGVDMATGTTYVNGQLRVTGSGATLDELAAGATGTSTAVVYAYKRSATDPATGWDAATTGPGAITWTFSSGSITTPTTLANSWLKAIPAGTDPLYVTVCTAANTTTTDDIAATEWATPVKLTQDGTSGTNGLNVATAILYQRNSSATVGPAAQANTVTFTFATGCMTGMSAGWTAAIPAASSGAYLWVTRATASATTTTDTMAAGEWSTPVLYTQDGIDGADGSNGTNGDAVDIVFQRSDSQPATPAASAGVPSGWYSVISGVPASSNPLWACTGQRASGATNYTWDTPVKIDGTAVAEVTVFRRSASAPATPTGGTYTFSTTPAITAPSLWSTSVPAGTDPVYTSRCVVSAPSGYTLAVTMSGWTTPVLSLQNGSTGATGTRGTIVTSITGAWNATTAAAAVSAIATAAGSTPTTPIKGDICYYTGGANQCTTAGNPGTWSAVAAYIDGSLVVTGTISSTQLSATAVDGKTITGAVIKTATSGARVSINEVINKLICHKPDGTYGFTVDTTTGTTQVSSYLNNDGLVSTNLGSGAAIKALGNSTGYGLVASGNTTKAPLALGALTATPSTAVNGDIYCNNSATVANRGLYAYVSGAWVNISKNVTTKSGGNNILFEWSTPNLQIYVDASLVATFNSSTKVWS